MKKGMSGIGVLIVFIAMILVAAVAAMVLLQTVGSLEGQALQTGKESTAEVSSKFRIMGISGRTNDATTPANVTYLRITGRLAPGSTSVDLNETLVSVLSGGSQISGIYYNMTTTNTEGDARLSSLAGITYSAHFLGKPSSYSTNDKKSIESDETIDLWINLGVANGLAPSIDFTVSVMPQRGVPESIPAQTPAAYTGQYVVIFP